jgi:hypothetical protein
LQQRGVAPQFAQQRLHRRCWKTTTTISALHIATTGSSSRPAPRMTFRVWQEPHIREIITHQEEAIHVAAPFHVSPVQQAQFNGRHGILLPRIVCITT